MLASTNTYDLHFRWAEYKWNVENIIAIQIEK